MHIADFFHTYPGMYIIQSFFHALIATIITGAAIEAWKIDSPIVRQRFRLSVILLAIFSFPLYQLINPERGTLFFRLDALFDSSRWLEMELWGVVPLYLFFIAIFVITSIIFVLQEMVPILRHFIEPTVDPQIAVIRPSEESPVGKALRGISAALPDVFIIHDEEMALFSNTRGKPAIYLSAGLANQLTAEQIQAAVAHEMAHIARSKFSVLLAGFILRTLMFFNPVVLVEFRRAIRNEEKICDDIAVSLTGKPSALAETLKKFYSQEHEEDPVGEDTPNHASRKISLEEYSHNLQIETRIARLEEGGPSLRDGAWFPLVFSFSIIAVINYYVV